MTLFKVPGTDVQVENSVAKEPVQFGVQSVGLSQHGFDVGPNLHPRAVPPPVNVAVSGNAHGTSTSTPGCGSAILSGGFVAGVGGGAGTAAPGTPLFNIKIANVN